MSIRYPLKPALVVGADVCLTNFLEVSQEKRPQNFGEDAPDRVNLLVKESECKWQMHCMG